MALSVGQPSYSSADGGASGAGFVRLGSGGGLRTVAAAAASASQSLCSCSGDSLMLEGLTSSRWVENGWTFDLRQGKMPFDAICGSYSARW